MAEVRLCGWNTYLLRVRAPRPFNGHLHAVPAIAHRAKAIGEALVGEYDVMGLQEVWRDEDLHRIQAAWSDTSFQAARCRSSWRPGEGSGLATIAAGPRIVRQAHHLFARRGRRWQDSDAWSDKGVLLVELELDDGARLEVCNTHLFAGGGFVFESPSTHPRLDRIRREQLAELLAFVARMHRPDNPLVILGDFNIAADSAAGLDLMERMGELGLVDAWAEHGEGPGATSDVAELGFDGFGSAPGEWSYCDDGRHHPSAVRIDYAFVRSGRGADLEVKGVWRRAWPRRLEAPEHHKLAWLSDHAALHVELEIR